MLSKLIALKNHAGFIRYFKNTSWMMAEQFLRIIAGLFVGVWMARYLGPEQFGLFSYVLAFTAIFGGIAKLGLDGIMVRALVNHPEKRDVYLGTAFWLKVIGAFIVMALMAAIVPFTNNDATTNLFIFIIAGGLLFQSFEVVEFYFQSQVLAKIISICKVIQLALSSIIKIYLVLTEAELIWFVLVTAFDALSLAISYFIAYKLRKNPEFYKHFDLSIAKQLLKDSWPLIISMGMATLYLKIDQIMVKEMLGLESAGIYAASTKLTEALYIIPFIISASLFPAILNARKSDKQLYKERITGLFSLIIVIGFLIALLVTLFSELIIRILFGEVFQDSANVMMVGIWSLIFVGLGNAASKWFFAEGLQKLFMYRTLFGLTVNVVLNYLFIPVYGVLGAAIATLLSVIFANFVSYYFSVRLKPLFILILRSFNIFNLLRS